MARNTKLKILKAAQWVIAEKGVASASHRTIAAKAGVRLSMTSYHLGSIDEILEACFDDFAERSRRHLEQLGGRLQHLVMEQGGALTEMNRVSAFSDQVSTLLAQYIYDEVQDRYLDLALECNFLYSYILPERIRVKVVEFDRGMVDMVTELFRGLGSDAPDLDSAIIVKLIRQIEFDHLGSKKPPDMDALKRLLRRAMVGLYSVPYIIGNNVTDPPALPTNSSPKTGADRISVAIKE